MIEQDHYRYIAFSAPDAIREVQENRLREHLVYCREHSPYYRRLLNNSGVDFESITLEQLSGLPFTEKSDIEQHNDEFCAVFPAKIVDIVLSSGTTGRPTRLMYTDYDLQRLAYNEKKSFEGCGITAEDMVLLTCTMDRCFVAGLAYFLGIRSLGAAAVRDGLNSLESHREIFKNVGTPTITVGSIRLMISW